MCGNAAVRHLGRWVFGVGCLAIVCAAGPPAREYLAPYSSGYASAAPGGSQDPPDGASARDWPQTPSAAPPDGSRVEPDPEDPAPAGGQGTGGGGSGIGGEGGEDGDGDGHDNDDDNCDEVYNPDQADTDEDGIGDACDPDVDGDGTPNGEDEDVDGDGTPNGEDEDVDGDGTPNGEDEDVDGDGTPNGQDGDVDGDGLPNGEDDDIDGDGVSNGEDSDADGDGISNGEDGDVDGDGVSNGDDSDVDGDGLTNGQDSDVDGDGISNGSDGDVDGDGTSNGDDGDVDGDGSDNGEDEDIDGDGTPNDQDDDMDGDGQANDEDEDDDGDGSGDDDDDDDDGGGNDPPEPHDPCKLDLDVRAVLFLTGPIYRWPDGAQLSPPPTGMWHYDVEEGGALWPVVSGCGGYMPLWLRVKLVSMTESCGSLNVPVRARLGSVVIAQRAFDFAPSWAPCEREDVLPAIDPLPLEAVGTIGQSVQFDYSLDGGATWKWFGAARPTKWYVVPDMYGLVPPGERYDLGLEKVLEYARGASTVEAIARRMNTGIAGDVCYNPSKATAAHILNSYFAAGGVHCASHTELLIYLCRTAGIGASRLYSWGGSSSEWLTKYFVNGHLLEWGTEVSFRLRARANDVAESDPHFLYHVVVEVGDVTCDPSYGATWLPGAIETASGAEQQSGPAFPPPHVCTVVWECEHPFGLPGECP